ncbi:hypothetical protein [uncultured Thalassospira sp.]|jgi:uncharacterized protein YjiS (DUF1127 family)|uniref:hypothetical protein n=1 Tax=uncultured Thalassospira sp. TaxID=404382 RepID=UPI0030DCBF59|tara:strand:+ start:2643 stop:2933 length:291 start_codon:yes stop_codon:yes gene_type:complete
MSTLPTTHLDRLVMNTTPASHAVTFQKLRQLFVKQLVNARLARSQRQLADQLSDNQLRDVGLERVFDGQNWKLQLIHTENTAPQRTTFARTTQDCR